jgi:hypothetical protein
MFKAFPERHDHPNNTKVQQISKIELSLGNYGHDNLFV